MADEPHLFAFPDLPDEAVIALNAFLEELYTAFQNHYFAQMHRCYDNHDRAAADRDRGAPESAPLPDPPF